MNLRLINHGAGMFTEIIAAFQRSAALVGHGASPADQPGEGINVYFVGHAGFMGAFRPPRGSINVLYNFEQRLPSGYRQFDAVMTIFSHTLREAPGLIFAPVGYAPAFETDLPAQDETIDAMHLGLLVESIKAEAGRRHGHLIHVVPKAFGSERDQLILSSRINLIIKSWPVYHFPVLRFLLFACKRRFVLAETHDSYSTVNPPRHLTLASSDLGADIKHWLAAGPNARREIADRVYEDLRTSCDYAALLEPALVSLQKRFRL